jgi:hypothetical protein
VEPTKRCPRCGEIKPVSEYGKDSSAKDLLKAACKQCHRVYDRRYCAANAAVRAARSKQWLIDNRERKAVYTAAYVKANAKRIADRQRAYRAEKRAAAKAGV